MISKNMRALSLLQLLLLTLSSFCRAWIAAPASSSVRRRQTTQKTRLEMAAVGIVFGTSTGSTGTVADLIFEAFGPDVAAEPVDVDTLDEGQLGEVFLQHDALVVGTPTWNTGADTERSGTGWDELYYGPLPKIQDELRGKKVAVFGLGDQSSYGENYADATGELFDVFEGMGCQMLGSWPQDGYEHEASKAIRGDKFCGLLLDMVNQEEMTEERVQRWVQQLKEEGILEGGSGGSSAAASAPTPVEADLSVINGAASDAAADDRFAQLDENSVLLDQTIGSHSTGGFTPHYNPVKGRTMWTSPDGRQSYVTVDGNANGVVGTSSTSAGQRLSP